MKVVGFSAISKVKATENRDVGNFIYIFGKGREGGLGRGPVWDMMNLSYL